MDKNKPGTTSEFLDRLNQALSDVLAESREELEADLRDEGVNVERIVTGVLRLVDEALKESNSMEATYDCPTCGRDLVRGMDHDCYYIPLPSPLEQRLVGMLNVFKEEDESVAECLARLLEEIKRSRGHDIF